MFARLRHSLTRWYLGILAVVLVGYGLGSYGATRLVMLGGLDRSSHRTLDAAIQALSRRDHDHRERDHHARQRSRRAREPHDEPRRSPLAKALAHELDEIPLDHREHLSWITAAGEVGYHRGLEVATASAIAPGDWTLERPSPMRVAVVPVPGQGVVRLGRSLLPLRRALDAQATIMAILVPLALGVAWAGGSWMARRAVAPIEAAIAREQRFSRDVSHELRTPLAVLLSHAQLAQAHPEVPSALRDKLDLLVLTARKMGGMVEDLLALGRAESGSGGAPVRFSMAELLDEELSALEPLAQQRQIEVMAPSDAVGGWVVGDPARIGQVVRNLLDNAIRYARAGTSLSVLLTQEGHTLVLAVSNQGPPIAPADRERIFERFERLEAGRQANPEGSGLGLAIAQAIAEAHGGSLVLERSDQTETRFVLRLPALRGA